MARAIVTSKGQVTIPKNIRDIAHIGTGTELDFVIEHGHIVITPMRASLSSLKGIVKGTRKRPIALKEMKNAIRQKAARKIA